MNGREDELREHAVMLEREVVRLRGVNADLLGALWDLHGALQQLVQYELTRDPNKGALFTAAMHRANVALARMESES